MWVSFLSNSLAIVAFLHINSHFSALEYELARGNANSALWNLGQTGDRSVYAEPMDEDDEDDLPAPMQCDSGTPGAVTDPSMFASELPQIGRGGSSTLSAALKTAKEGPSVPASGAGSGFVGGSGVGTGTAETIRRRQFAKHKKLGSLKPEPEFLDSLQDESTAAATSAASPEPQPQAQAPAAPAIVNRRQFAKHRKLASPKPVAADDFQEPEPAAPADLPHMPPADSAAEPENRVTNTFSKSRNDEEEGDAEPTTVFDELFQPDDELLARRVYPSPEKAAFQDVPESHTHDLTPLLSYGFNNELGMPARTPTYQTFKNLGSDDEDEGASCWDSVFGRQAPGSPDPGRRRGLLVRGRRGSTGPPPRGVWGSVKANFNVRSLLLDPLSYIPAVFLGLLMNVLDALSYGLIIFPNEDIFPTSAPSAGISIFFITTVVAQITYSIGLSRFKGANGSMMIEVIPFLHAMCASVAATVRPMAGDDDGSHRRKVILATVMVCYVLSTLLTGATFLLLGLFKMGNIMSFFPRHLLIATIGGIGMFLILTGIEVTSEVDFSVSFAYLKAIFDPLKLMLWGTSAGIAIVLQFLSHRIRHPLFVPCFFLLVPATFYVVVFAAHISLEELRKYGWLFNLAQPGSEQSSPFEFYSYFSLTNTRWDAVLVTLPTIVAVAFFGVLHVPINIPALSVSTGTEVDTNGELIAHGVSNLLAGFVGTIQNYLVYSNSLLFIRSGGDSRVAGLMLSLATGVVFFVGTWLVDYVPVIVVGALIFHLGFDLVRESLIDVGLPWRWTA
jgi:MFS superfamily sulfate permease-like transporter